MIVYSTNYCKKETAVRKKKVSLYVHTNINFVSLINDLFGDY